MLRGVVAELIVGENGSGHDVGSHVKSSIVWRARGKQAARRHKSITTSSAGCAQQISKLPSAGASTGSGRYLIIPATSPVSQVWQTPVRHANRTGTSQASASSSKLGNDGPKRTLRQERATDTSGPVPGAPAGKCGGRRG